MMASLRWQNYRLVRVRASGAHSVDLSAKYAQRRRGGLARVAETVALVVDVEVQSGGDRPKAKVTPQSPRQRRRPCGLGAQTDANTRRASRKVQPRLATSTSACPAPLPSSPTAPSSLQNLQLGSHHDESQKVFWGRSGGPQPCQQGLRTVYQKWQGSEDREGALLAARHPMLVQTLLSMLGRRSQRLQRQGYVSQCCPFPC